MAEGCAADGGSLPEHRGPEATPSEASRGAQGEEELVRQEEELTREVPLLLETMNRTSSEVNTLEQQVTEAQARYKKLLEQWSRLYEDVRAQLGSAVDRVKPYFEAAQVLETSSQRVQSAVHEFSAASSQHSVSKRELRELEERLAYGAHKVKLDGEQQAGLSRATVHVLRCQQERDRREQEYARALRDYQEAQEALDAWRLQIGDSAIKRALPCFRQLQKHQTTLAAEQTRINTLSERTRQAKAAYENSLRELDRINVAVHDARRNHAKASQRLAEERWAGEAAAKAEAPPEETPEATPEEAVPEPLSAHERAALDALGDVDADCGSLGVGVPRVSYAAATPRAVEVVEDEGPFA